MGKIKQLLMDKGYNLKERAYIYTGATVGALAPIVGARYLLFRTESNSLFEELVAWGTSLLANACTAFIPPFVPVPGYTAAVGMGLGAIAAEHSKRKRPQTLENIAECSKE